MKLSKQTIRTMWVIAVLPIFYSCNDKALNTINENVVSTTDYFKTSDELLAGTNSIYATVRNISLVSREWFFLHDLRSDDAAAGGSQLEVPRFQILSGNTDPTNSVMNSVWNGLYTVIHRANTVIQNGPNVTDNTAVRDRVVAEAKFLRAWAYFELVTFWGAVPLYTSPVKTPADYQARADVNAVYTLIVEDLRQAATTLPNKSATDKGRATNGAANALLGRVLMQRNDYAGAKEALLKVTTSGAYTLTDRYLDNFEEETEFNAESIFEVVYVDKGDNDFNWGGNDTPNSAQSTIRNQEYNPVAWRNLIPSDKLLNEFENTATGAAKTDPRYSFSFYQTGDRYNNDADVLTDADQNGNSSTVNGVRKKVSVRKFMILYKEGKAKASYHPGGNNQRIIRYAEVLINLAECEAELGNLTAAVNYLNQVRARKSVAMPAYPTSQYPTSTKAQVIKAVMHEKMVEHSFECIRSIDILRWRPKGYFTQEPFAYFRSQRDELLPLPIAELDNNPLVSGKQNPGY
ncbi:MULTISPECIES: RagB/SusD family nutrient uptake outer membrane protein [unclassified Siphonobacter]|uniref:RagB/SusD family nutrient uptake outer membrane protein n=1 Tax=unclassified Siphonobacter TaxID=2635712 RepID=UPI000CC27AA4|nr:MULTISPECIES: RagB/SusD family nutrient uptake outer membrane protein [unclassified Siphonobacter]MDQ1085559.1 tetratricopeptide (TPR) repeat protein [Siphonobacter sp. SORGH_AS_1065]MDR6197358.1 tetratricopeptide (TPR) repeat protein [Siphonobacter sp. SORGH_AS_0500]PKK34829.1 RagB/SusD family nutrient uptake outer membrane protein [Siphonobacter sp. SORGH_AS_0500]